MIVRRTRSLVFAIGDVVFQPIVLLALTIVIDGVISFYLARYLSRPIEHLRARVRILASGDLQSSVETSLMNRQDELGSLARDFERMVTSLREIIASKEELLRDVSHELRSPLARLRVATGLARQGSAGICPDEFDRIDLEVRRLDTMIGQILRFFRLGTNPAPALELLDLRELLEEAVEDANLEAAAQKKSLRLWASVPPPFRGDRMMLLSAIENVLRNAVRFAPAQSTIEVELASISGAARIAVSDLGPGVPTADLRRIFEPFFRASSTGSVGLGLAIAERIIASHGGTISATNRPEGGLRVELVLPCDNPPLER